MKPLTARQELILQFIRDSIHKQGYPPTLREIGLKMGIRSTNGVSDHLRALERKGHLYREDMKSRALRPVNAGPTSHSHPPMDATADVADLHAGDLNHHHDRQENHDQNQDHHRGPGSVLTDVPLLGRVAAGALALTADTYTGHYAMDRALLGKAAGGGEVFALRVKGDSMIEADIHDGDTIFVRKTPTASRGEIVVARLGEEATVKRYFPEPEKGRVRLQPENRALGPIYIRGPEAVAAGFEILGVVVGLFRSIAAR